MSQATNNTDDPSKRTLEELCADIANNDDHSDRMRELAAAIRDGIQDGDIDAT